MMGIPGWLLDVFAATMLLVAAVSAAQLAAGYPSRWVHADADIAVSHLLMGVAMPGMLVAGLRTLPSVAWEVIFAVMAVWFAWSAWQRSRGAGFGALARDHYAPHLVHSVAMLYMFLALAAPAAGGGPGMGGPGMGGPGMGGPGMGGTGGAGGSAAMQTLRLPVLAFLFVLLLAGYTVRDLDRWAGSDGYFHVLRPGVAPAGPARATTGPGLVALPAGGAPTDHTATDRGVALAARPPEAAVRDTGPGQPAPAAVSPGAAVLLTPGVVKACRVAMGVTMAFMLIIMI